MLPFADSSAWVNALLYALGLMAMGLSFAYERRIWNIGAEGQWIAGSLCAGLVLALMPGWTSSITLLAMLLAGAIGGLLWAAPVAWLKNQKNVDEIVSSLMLSYIAQQVLHYFSQLKSANQHTICAKNSNSWLVQYPSLLLGALALGLGIYTLAWAERRFGGRTRWHGGQFRTGLQQHARAAPNWHALGIWHLAWALPPSCWRMSPA